MRISSPLNLNGDRRTTRSAYGLDLEVALPEVSRILRMRRALCLVDTQVTVCVSGV